MKVKNLSITLDDTCTTPVKIGITCPIICTISISDTSDNIIDIFQIQKVSNNVVNSIYKSNLDIIWIDDNCYLKYKLAPNTKTKTIYLLKIN